MIIKSSFIKSSFEPAVIGKKQAAKKKQRYLYFAYGSNLNIKQMAKRCPKARALGIANLSDYQLVFNGVADVVPREGALVPGAVWEITEGCLRELDHYEGYPTLYGRELVEVEIESSGERVQAIVYRMNTEHYRTRRELPYISYYHAILEGYDDFGLAKHHLDKAIDLTRKEMKK